MALAGNRVVAPAQGVKPLANCVALIRLRELATMKVSRRLAQPLLCLTQPSKPATAAALAVPHAASPSTT